MLLCFQYFSLRNQPVKKENKYMNTTLKNQTKIYGLKAIIDTVTKIVSENRTWVSRTAGKNTAN
jgi:hypothetical protein